MPALSQTKIVFISRTSGTAVRGVETFVHELGNRLTRLGLDITVIQNGPSLSSAQYQTISLNLPDTTSQFQFTVQALRKFPAHVSVAIPINGGWQPILTRAYAWLHSSRMIITGHSGLGRDDLINLWSFPDIFIAQTTHQAHWARRRQLFIKHVVIPSGVDTDVFNPDVSPHKFDLRRPIILNVGALESIKRQELLIKAASQLKASVLLVGQGSREQELWALGRKYLGVRFHIQHFRHQDMPGVYAACDVLAYPTAPWESFGLAILEAMAVGKPVVVSDDPIRREIIGSAGLAVNPEDQTAFTHTLELALRKKWGQQPRNQALEFSWNKIANSYFKLLNRT